MGAEKEMAMTTRHLWTACGLAVSLLVLPIAIHASCDTGRVFVVFCPTPALLGNAWTPAAQWNPSTGLPDPAYALGCARVGGKIANATVIEEREWRTKEGVATLIHVDFGGRVRGALGSDKYSAEGEYLGTEPTYYSSGWFLKRELQCDASPNVTSRSSNSGAAPVTSASLSVTPSELAQRANALLSDLQSPMRVAWQATEFGATASLSEHLQVFGTIDKATGKLKGFMLATDADDDQGKANFLAAVTALTGAALPGRSKQQVGSDVTALIQSYKGPAGSTVTRAFKGAKLSFGTGTDGKPWYALDAL
jgi:hypothetical protein